MLLLSAMMWWITCYMCAYTIYDKTVIRVVSAFIALCLSPRVL